MGDVDLDSDADSSSDALVRRLHDLLVRNSLSVSVAADSSDVGDGFDEEAVNPWFVSTGWSQLDAILPGGGLQQGMLLECLGAVQGGGVALLGLWFAWQMLSPKSSASTEKMVKPEVNLKHELEVEKNQGKGGVLVVFDNDRRFYPPVAAALGIALDRLMIVTPESKKDLYWALDQVLRCPAVGAVWSCMSKVSSREFRRLQLAAEAGRALGVLVRERKFARSPTWAHVRLQISSLPAQVTDGLYRRSEAPQASENIEIGASSSEAGDWRFQVERKRAVSAMIGHLARVSECEIDLRDVIETSGVGQLNQPDQLEHLEQLESVSSSR